MNRGKGDRLRDLFDGEDENVGKVLKCGLIEACENANFVHDIRAPNDYDRKANARMVVVGTKPSEGENRVGLPFLDSSRKKRSPFSYIVDRELKKLKIQPRNVYFTNVVKCRTTMSRNGKRIDRTPNEEEINACIPLLKEEIKIISPKAIIAMGKVPIQSLTGQPSVERAIKRGVIYKDGIAILPTYHEAYSRYNLGKLEEIRSHREKTFEKAASIARGKKSTTIFSYIKT